MSEPLVRDYMHHGVVGCAPDTSLEEIAALMSERDVSAVVVAEHGVAVGLISQTDLVNAAFVQPYMRYWRGMSARHLMTAPVVAIAPDAPLRAALELLRQHRIHRLVVTEPSAAGPKPVGILSMKDLVRALGAQAVPEAAS